MTSPGLEPGPRLWEAGDNSLSYGKAFLENFLRYFFEEKRRTKVLYSDDVCSSAYFIRGYRELYSHA
jgi:hypothetical protein